MLKSNSNNGASSTTEFAMIAYAPKIITILDLPAENVCGFKCNGQPNQGSGQGVGCEFGPSPLEKDRNAGFVVRPSVWPAKI